MLLRVILIQLPTWLSRIRRRTLISWRQHDHIDRMGDEKEDRDGERNEKGWLTNRVRGSEKRIKRVGRDYFADNGFVWSRF